MTVSTRKVAALSCVLSGSIAAYSSREKSSIATNRYWRGCVELSPLSNGKEYKGTPQHAFVAACHSHGIGQKFTRVNRPQTNGKAERVIRTLMEMWHQQLVFTDTTHRQRELVRFINFYNTVKPHKGLNNATPYEILWLYFTQPLNL